MPKMKTKKSAAKRFQVRGSGSIKRGQAFKRHILTKKTTKNKRQLRGSAAVHETNVASVKAMMPSLDLREIYYASRQTRRYRPCPSQESHFRRQGLPWPPR